jgi:hypothetical protein
MLACVRHHIDKEPNHDVVGGSVCVKGLVGIYHTSFFVFVLGIRLTMCESVSLEMGTPV